MRKIFIIAARELFETVKTKTFFISVVLVPVLISAVIFGMEKVYHVAKQEQRPARRIVLLDESGLLAEALAAQLLEYNRKNPYRPFEIVPDETVERDALRRRVRPDDLYAFIALPADVLDNPAARVEVVRLDNQMEIGQQLERMTQEAVVAVRFRRADPPLDRDRVLELQAPVGFVDIDAQSGQPFLADKMARVMTPFVFMFLLWMGTMGISQGLLTSVIEEKSSRVIEVLLSAVTPTQLMAGKILGMVAVGLILMLVWGGVGFATARAQQVGHLVTGQMLLLTSLYFVPGFLFSAAFLASLGAACNTLKEAQSMATPLSLLNMIPIFFWLPVSQLPDSTLSLVLSFIPPITPAIMVLRICADPHTPIWQILATLVLLWLTVLATIWFAAKVFRIGVLMYGKPPTVRELLRWAREA